MGLHYLLAPGAELDCVINLDGFNEVALVNENLRDASGPGSRSGFVYGMLPTCLESSSPDAVT